LSASRVLTLLSDIKAKYVFEPDSSSEADSLEYLDDPPTVTSTQDTLYSSQSVKDFVKPRSSPNEVISANAQQMHMYNCLPHSESGKSSNCIEDYLKGMYGKDATWRVPEQRDAVAALLKLEQDVIVALGAGVGKTAVAILPSMVEDGYTVITVGLKSLMDDWQHRLTKLNVPFEVYRSDADLQGSKNLILVTVDRARQNFWQTRLSKLHQRRPVLRLVVDEAHQFFTDLEFRNNAFGNAFGLRSVPCQLVLMSASLPPNSISHLSSTFGLRDPAIFRSPALSPVLSFHINPKPTLKARMEALKTFAGDCHNRGIMGPDDRILVFVSFKEDGQYAAQELNCSFYNGGQDVSDKQRQTILDSWRNTSQPYLVATSSLSSGFDYAHVRIVFFLNLPPTMILFYQQAHRAGRDGKPAICMILDTKLPKRNVSDLEKLSGALEMEAIDRDKVCLRFQASQFLDGHGRTCAEWGDSYAKCDRCSDGTYGSSSLAFNQSLTNSSRIFTTANSNSGCSSFFGPTALASDYRYTGPET
jgi:superfamily II DNA helicase RecQ